MTGNVIAVTGASSFIGRPLVERLAKSGYFIIPVVRNLNGVPDILKENAVFCDMRSYEELYDRIKERFDAITVNCLVHLAWNGTRGSNRQDGKMQKENFDNSVMLARTMLNGGCKKIVLAGSQAEYGSWNEKIDENHTCLPTTQYGKYKLQTYETIKDMCEKSGVVCIEPRFFSLYGPGDFSGTMVMSTIEKMLKNEDCEFTPAKQMWDYLYIDDAVSGILKIIESKTAVGIYNFGSGDARPLRLYIEEMRDVIGSKSNLRFGAVSYPPSGMVSIHPDIEKLKGLGFVPETSFKTGIETVVRGRVEP